MRFWEWLRRQPRRDYCKRCRCYQRTEHRHYILDKDDPQWDGHKVENRK